MDKRLLAKIEPIERLAAACGWDTQRVEERMDGMTGVQLVGTTFRGDPEAAHGVEFGFSVAFAINPMTGRAIALRLDGKPNAIFVVTTVEDGRYWFGPLSAHKRALDQPDAWTGVSLPTPAGA